MNITLFRKPAPSTLPVLHPIETYPHPALAGLSHIQFMDVSMDRLVTSALRRELKHGDSASVSLHTKHKTLDGDKSYKLDIKISRNNKFSIRYSEKT